MRIVVAGKIFLKTTQTPSTSILESQKRPENELSGKKGGISSFHFKHFKNKKEEAEKNSSQKK